MSLAPSEQLAVAVWQILADRLGLADAPPGHRLIENGRPTIAAIDLADAPRLSAGEKALASFAAAEWMGKLGSLAAVVRSCDADVRGRVLDAVMASHAMDRIVDGVLADTATTVDWATERITAIRALLTAWDTDEEAEHEQLVRAIRCCVSGDPVPPEITAAAHTGIAAARAQHPTASMPDTGEYLCGVCGGPMGDSPFRYHDYDCLNRKGTRIDPAALAARVAEDQRLLSKLGRSAPPATAAVESQVVVDPGDTWAGVLDEAEFLSEESYPDADVMDLDQPKPKVVDLMDQLEQSLAIAKAARAAREAGA